MLSFNVNLLGDAGVGKTSWLRKISANTFVPCYSPTCGYNTHHISVNTNHGSINLNFYDYAGQDKYSNIIYHNRDASIVMFDFTNKSTYKNISFWLNKGEHRPVFIIGNKSDCYDIKVSPILPHTPSSAKTMSPEQLLTPILQHLSGFDDLAIIP